MDTVEKNKMHAKLKIYTILLCVSVFVNILLIIFGVSHSLLSNIIVSIFMTTGDLDVLFGLPAFIEIWLELSAEYGIYAAIAGALMFYGNLRFAKAIGAMRLRLKADQSGQTN